MAAVRLGAVYPQIELGGDPDAVRRIGDALGGLGYDHLLAYDHVLGAVHADRDPTLLGPYTERDPFHDPFVLFAYLAGRCPGLEFVTGILILPQRQTALVARQAADLSLLSGGRFRLGVGIGWNHVEYTALGQDFSTRGAREEEQIEVLRALWSGAVVDFEGRFDRIERATTLPAPVEPVPVWLGGFSEPAVERAARVGDGFIFAGSEANVLQQWQRLRELLGDHDRKVEGFGAQYNVLSKDGPNGAAAKIERWADNGGTHAAVVTMGLGLDSVDAHLDYLGEVAAALGRGSIGAGPPTISQ